MKAYLRLRLRVMGRQLAEVGWVRLVLLGLLAVAAMGKLLELLLAQPSLAWAGPAVGLLTSWSGHRQRTDLGFLQIASPRFRRWLAVEYGLWLLPIWALLLGLGHFGPALATVAGAGITPFLPVWQLASRVQQRRSWFRSEAFEWVSGFRQTGAGLVWSAGLLLALWQHASVVPAAVLGGWSLFVTIFYTTPEPVTMVTTYSRGAAAFRRRKLGLAAGLYLLTAAPFFLLMGTSLAGWAAAVAGLMWGAVVVAMGVMGKYAFYPQPTLLRLTQGGVVVVALLPLLHSSYASLFVAALVGLIWKSHQRLKVYWHA